MSTELVGVGDQVQETCVRSGLPIIGFLIVTSDGRAEYRSPLPIEELRAMLTEAVRVL